ncbi:alpha-ketoglutarate-dependent dioxygenase AlkB [Trichocoleus sp. FACHB-262]|uniref:alpha-ketoglutarate-dependent dioxygenase AlkB family protein n=1 Tax=Trichocoleus sp. FACHB-262 TaxID=2692869 RepID=UPI001F54DB47|nr:alpha-ketoglutarate-dependent dioxygenase AlkB [Trichocoleus sp. FACHB-262]
MSLWQTVEDPPKLLPQLWEMPDANIVFYEQLFSAEESDRLFAKLDLEIQWQQDYIHVFGKTIPLPRLTAWYGEAGKSYIYSDIEMHPAAWTSTLLEIKAKVEAHSGVTFNSVLLNQYRTGQDSVAWHSDDEPELGQNPIIGSVSFGGTRRFILRHKYQKEQAKVSIDLTHGSFLLMRGTTQHFWQHQISKTAKLVKPRINLTFRVIT